MRVLVIEDDATMRAAIELTLTAQGFNVYGTDDGEDGVELAKLYGYDAITLDLTLTVPGFEVIRRIRAAKIKTPILVLCGLDTVGDKVAALDLGADDYMAKPFHNAELAARLRALVRRSRGVAESKIVTGNITLCMATKTVEVDGVRVNLTGKEYAMFELLSLRKGATVSKEAFLSYLYGGLDEPELKIVDVFICKIRKKMKAVNAHPVETSWGHGYVLRDPQSGAAAIDAAALASLVDEPPTGHVSNMTMNSWKEANKAKRTAAAVVA